MNIGYIAIWRKIQDHRFYKEKRVYSKLEAWIDILLEVQYYDEPKQVVIGMALLTRNYGESLKSLRTWAARWQWSRGKVKRYINLLRDMGQIRYADETVTSRITVLNYSRYDLKKLDGEPQVDRKQISNGSQSSRNRTLYKKEKKEKNKELPKKEPCRVTDLESIEVDSESKIKKDLDKLCEFLYDTKIFLKAPIFVNTMRKQKKNDRTILHTLVRCKLKAAREKFPDDKAVWAYCTKIIQVEDGNYNEKDFRKTS